MSIEYVRLNKDEPVIAGSDVRCISGSVVSTRFTGTVQDLEVKYRFNWATWTEVQTLLTAWKNGTAVSIYGQSVILDAKDGVSGVKHQAWGDAVDPADFTSYDTDLWTGELKGYIKV